MKNILIILFVALIQHCTAQHQPYGLWYNIDGIDYYETRGNKPTSQMAFYSQKGGGMLLTKEHVDVEGRVLLKGTQDLQPAFALSNGFGGTGMTHFFEQKDFSFKDWEAKITNNVMEISWKAEVAEVSLYRFVMLRGSNDAQFDAWQNIPVVGEGLNAYSLPVDPEAGYYKLQLVHNERGVVYTSDVLAITRSMDIIIFPQPVSSELHVSVKAKETGMQYVIISHMGQELSKGKLDDRYNRISVSHLLPGSYLLKVTDGNGRVIDRRFIKL